MVNLEVTDALIFRGSGSGRYAVHRSSVVVVRKDHKSMYAIRSERWLQKKFGSPLKLDGLDWSTVWGGHGQH